MRLASHIEVMCPGCRKPIRVPLSATLMPPDEHGAAECIVNVAFDEQVLEAHRCPEPTWTRVSR